MSTQEPQPANTPLTMPPSATHSTSPRALADRSGAGITDEVRAQLLAAEHASLLATRSMTWNEIFSRASMFITVLSAAVIALALVAQATGFGPAFRLFAVLVLLVVLLVGVATSLRLSDANLEDLGLVMGMNRLRHAYVELAPELEPYFLTAHHDDPVSVGQTYSLGLRSGSSHALASTPTLVGAIIAVVVGVLAALIAVTLGVPTWASVVVGVVAALLAAVGHSVLVYRRISRAWSASIPRFPR